MGAFGRIQNNFIGFLLFKVKIVLETEGQKGLIEMEIMGVKILLIIKLKSDILELDGGVEA